MRQTDPLSRTTSRKRLSVAFLLAENFTLSAFANFVDVLRLAADEADKSRPILCDWSVLSDTLAPIRSSCGVKVTPDTLHNSEILVMCVYFKKKSSKMLKNHDSGSGGGGRGDE